MGAYGSPELYPVNQQMKKKKKNSGCLKNFLIFVFLLVVFFFLFVIVSSFLKSKGNSSSSSGSDLLSLSPVSQKSISSAVSVVPKKSVSSSNTLPVFTAPKLSNDYLKLWAEGVVIKYYTAPIPKSAKFSDNSSDWTFTSKGDLYGISSVVSTDSDKKTFMVVVLYTSDTGVQDLYLKVGDKVIFDKTASQK